MSEMKVAAVAHDGPTALEMVRNVDLDALLLDIILPEAGRLCRVGKTRELPKRPRIIVFPPFATKK